MRKFVERWLQTAPGDEGVAPPCVPGGRRVYCIGDIHGRLDLLRELHGRIEGDAGGYPGETVIVYLGDYIDRGEESRGVIEYLLGSPLAGFAPVYLLGNHEQTLLDFLRHPRSVASWLQYGGRATLQSYGIDAGPASLPGDIMQLRDELAGCLPVEHLDFLRGCRLMHVEGNYCFVHAGIRPGVPLQQQRDEDLLWLRDEFINSTAQHEHVVVHGHTISEQVEFRPNRIGIDTGAFYTGVLTCLVLEGEDRRLLQTGSGE